MVILTFRRAFAAAALVASVSLFPAYAQDPPMTLTVRPLLCVLDKAATNCMMTFDIRWKSLTAGEFCLNDTLQVGPRICWGNPANPAESGNTSEQRQVSEEFMYWIGAPSGTERLAEVKISVLRVGSTDRRRERRTRHVWDVL